MANRYAGRRIPQKWACVAWLNGERHRFQVPLHHHIYCAGDDYVIGWAKSRCEYWRRPRSTIATIEIERDWAWPT